MSKDVVTSKFDVNSEFTFDIEDITSVDPDEISRDRLEELAYAEAVAKIASKMEESPERYINLRFWKAKSKDEESAAGEAES